MTLIEQRTYRHGFQSPPAWGVTTNDELIDLCFPFPPSFLRLHPPYLNKDVYPIKWRVWWRMYICMCMSEWWCMSLSKTTSWRWTIYVLHPYPIYRKGQAFRSSQCLTTASSSHTCPLDSSKRIMSCLLLWTRRTSVGWRGGEGIARGHGRERSGLTRHYTTCHGPTTLIKERL